MDLALVMDALRRTIVGYDCNDALEAIGALRALKMAMRQRPAGARVMHHRDRGIQYCCGDDIHRLTDANLAISMTEQNHCYENSQAERRSGVLQYGLGRNATFDGVSAARLMLREAL